MTIKFPYPELLAAGSVAALIAVVDHAFPAALTEQSRADLSNPANLWPMAVQGMGLSAAMSAVLWPVRRARWSMWVTASVAIGTVALVCRPATTWIGFGYILARFFVPAFVWCALYWKRGLASSVYAHAAVYLVFGWALVFVERIAP